jgi:hypothetical protein
VEFSNQLLKQKIHIAQIYIVIILLIFLNRSDNPIISYTPFFVLIFFTFTNLLLQKKLFYKRSNTFLFYAPFIMFILWLYGVLMGVLHNNNLEFIFRNFFGMSLYISFYFLNTFEIPLNKFLNIVINCCLIILVYNFIDIKNIVSNIAINYFSERQLFDFNQIFLFTLFPIILGSIILNYNIDNSFLNNKIKKYIIIFLVCFFSILLTQSKGIYISIIITIFAIVISLIKKLRNINIIYIILYIILILFFLIIGLWFYYSSEIVILNDTDISNLNRYEQIDAILSELTFFGKGLGASFTTPALIRDSDLPYALEITYFNLSHKIGIFSLFAFYIYFKSILKAFSLVYNNDNFKILYGFMILGLMTFIFPSIGNPLLFAPYAVFSHCLALYFINKIEIRQFH